MSDDLRVASRDDYLFDDDNKSIQDTCSYLGDQIPREKGSVGGVSLLGVFKGTLGLFWRKNL